MERKLSSPPQGNGPSININIVISVHGTMNYYLAGQAGVGNTSEEEECEYGKNEGRSTLIAYCIACDSKVYISNSLLDHIISKYIGYRTSDPLCNRVSWKPWEV